MSAREILKAVSSAALDEALRRLDEYEAVMSLPSPQKETAHNYIEHGWSVTIHDDGRVTAVGPSFGVAILHEDGSIAGMKAW